MDAATLIIYALHSGERRIMRRPDLESVSADDVRKGRMCWRIDEMPGVTERRKGKGSAG